MATISTTHYLCPIRIDFRRCADDIKDRAGISYFQQSAAIGKEWSTFQRWLNGARPRHADGEMFLMFHSYACGPELTQQRRMEAVQFSLTAPSM